MARSLRASIAGIETAKRAFKRKGWTQEFLAGRVNCSRQTVGKFFDRGRVERRIFQPICEELEVAWDDIAEPEESGSARDNRPDSSDELVGIVRDIIQDKVQKRYGTMKVLDMSQPIGLDDIYTNVKILEKITGRRWLSVDQLTENASSTDSIPGLEATERYDKLMILGKPGAGKTTFLKHLAIQCFTDSFHSEYVPVFVSLKEFAEAPNQPELLSYLNELLLDYGLASVPKSKTDSDETFIEQLLRQDKVLILLDGLDEVKKVDSVRVIQQIQSLTNRFDRNRFVITCRIAAQEFTFEHFTEVEIADFDDEQIANFVNKWFYAKDDEVKAESFIQNLKTNKRIEELASSPLLLTMLCIVFEDAGSFPSNQAELYKEGLNVLLKKWDMKRNIERDPIYQGLHTGLEKELLSKIAYQNFTDDQLFFLEQEITEQIAAFLADTLDAPKYLDGANVLNAIEFQQGILVERAANAYSFSHLTLQEYLAAQYISSQWLIDELVCEHLTDKRWREVFLLVSGLVGGRSHELLLAMEQQANTFISLPKLQGLLQWATNLSDRSQLSNKLLASRAWLLVSAIAKDSGSAIASALPIVLPGSRARADRIIAIAKAIAKASTSALDSGTGTASTSALDLASKIDNVIASKIKNEISIVDYCIRVLDSDEYSPRAISMDKYSDSVIARASARASASTIAKAIARASTIAKAIDYGALSTELEDLQKQIPFKDVISNDWQNFADQLLDTFLTFFHLDRELITFSLEEAQALEKYLYAVELIIDCKNAAVRVSRKEWEAIESRLLTGMGPDDN
ncbi:NACHT domain-containing protein [Leptothoe sp. ISB3NOV94-8A]